MPGVGARYARQGRGGHARLSGARAQAGARSPGLSLSAAISALDRPRTARISRSAGSVLARCLAAASTALSADAMATLKNLKVGAACRLAPIQRTSPSFGALGTAGRVTWTTQPARAFVTAADFTDAPGGH